MGLLKRVGWYLVGLSIGLVFLVFFLKKKSGENGIDFCYLPNCRVLKDIRTKKISFTDELRNDMASQNLDSLSIMAFLENGQVDFKNSNTKSIPCKSYNIRRKLQNKDFWVTVENCDSTAVITALKIQNPEL